jgi:hypothetical protein
MRASLALLFTVALTAISYTGCASPTPELEDDNGAALTSESEAAGKANTDGFKDIPDMTAAQKQAILDRYASIQHDGIRQELYEKAILYYDTNVDRIQNKNYLSVVDFKKASGKHRFFIMDMNGGPMTSHVVAHGVNSDPDNTGTPSSFSNDIGSLQSSVGFYVTAETYDGVHGESLKLDGLSTTNSNVRERVVVIHSAAYVEDGRTKQGMSQGCLAVPEAEKPEIVLHLKNGSVIYAMN